MVGVVVVVVGVEVLVGLGVVVDVVEVDLGAARTLRERASARRVEVRSFIFVICCCRIRDG